LTTYTVTGLLELNSLALGDAIRYLNEVKRRNTKKTIKKEELNLTASLQELLLDAERGMNSKSLSNLNSAIAYLLGAHLQITSALYHRLWWVDDVEWTVFSRSENGVIGAGKIWFGCRAKPAEMINSDFNADLRLLRSGQGLSVSYDFILEIEGVKFFVSSRQPTRQRSC